MDILKTLSMPQSMTHFHILIVIGGLIWTILYPYLGFLLGSSILSFVLRRKGQSEGKPELVAAAKSLIEIPLLNKTVPTFLALLPSFSLIFVYAQLMQSTEAMSVGLAGYGYLLLLIAVVLLYTYKYTFRLSGILTGYEDVLKSGHQTDGGIEELHSYSRQTDSSLLKAGRWGIVFLVLASFTLVASIPITDNPENWSGVTSVFDLFISADVLMKCLQFAAVAAGATGVGILCFFFSWTGEHRKLQGEAEPLVRRIALRLIIVSLLTQPVFILAGLYLLPEVSLSGSLYGFVGAALILIFVTAQFVYAYAHDPQARYANASFSTLLLAVVFLVVNDHLAIHNATNAHAAYLAFQDNKSVEELQARLGVSLVTFTGEDIYNARCSACHLFDQKKVGPAYKDVIPQFEGKKAQLIAFVLNPVKVNPLFPPMPNPGLKPAEADSIATFLLAKFAKPADSVATHPVGDQKK